MSCSIDLCATPIYSRLLCKSHYLKAYRRGELAGRPYAEKFRSWTVAEVLYECDRVGDCLLWRGTPSASYPELRHNGVVVKVHRFVYESHNGVELEPGAQVHHTCANSRCVNPAHLQRASGAENKLEMLARRDYEARISALEARVRELEAQLDTHRSMA